MHLEKANSRRTQLAAGLSKEPGLPPKAEVLFHPSCAGGRSHGLVFMEGPEALTDLDFIPSSATHAVTHIPCCLLMHNGAGKTLIIFMT